MGSLFKNMLLKVFALNKNKNKEAGVKKATPARRPDHIFHVGKRRIGNKYNEH
jgi:hypothetical protein